MHVDRFNDRCDYNIVCIYIYYILLWCIIIVYGVQNVQYSQWNKKYKIELYTIYIYILVPNNLIIG